MLFPMFALSINKKEIDISMSSLKTDFLIHISQFLTCTLILKIESLSQWIKRNNIVNESKKKN